MIDKGGETKTVGIAINIQGVFNPLVEAATLRLSDSQMANSANNDFNVSSTAIVIFLPIAVSMGKRLLPMAMRVSACIFFF